MTFNARQATVYSYSHGYNLARGKAPATLLAAIDEAESLVVDADGSPAGSYCALAAMTNPQDIIEAISPHFFDHELAFYREFTHELERLITGIAQARNLMFFEHCGVTLCHFCRRDGHLMFFDIVFAGQPINFASFSLLQ